MEINIILNIKMSQWIIKKNNNNIENNCFNKIETPSPTPIHNKKSNLFFDNNQFNELSNIFYEIIDSEKNIEILKKMWK